jgi:hypothetical protein
MGTIGFGKVQVRGLSRTPSPPAMITALTYTFPPLLHITDDMVTIIELFVFMPMGADLFVALHSPVGDVVPVEPLLQIQVGLLIESARQCFIA